MDQQPERPPQPDSPDFDCTEIERKSELAEVEMQEFVASEILSATGLIDK